MPSREEIKQHEDFIRYGEKILKKHGYNFHISDSTYSTIVLGNYGEEIVLSPHDLLTCEKLYFSIKFTLERVDEPGVKRKIFEETVLLNELDKL